MNLLDVEPTLSNVSHLQCETHQVLTCFNQLIDVLWCDVFSLNMDECELAFMRHPNHDAVWVVLFWEYFDEV